MGRSVDAEESGSDNIILLPVDDFPDIVEGSIDDVASSPARSFETRETFTAALRASLDAVETSNSPRVSTGRLKRPSKPVLRQLPSRPAGALLRTLGPTQRARPDTFDLGLSPESAPRLKRTDVSRPGGISPLRKQRARRQVPDVDRALNAGYAKDQQQINAQLEIETEQQTEAVASPRRSRRAKNAHTDAHDEHAVEASAALQDVQANAGAVSDEREDALRYQDYFRSNIALTSNVIPLHPGHPSAQGTTEHSLAVSKRKAASPMVEIRIQPPADDLDALAAQMGSPTDGPRVSSRTSDELPPPSKRQKSLNGSATVSRSLESLRKRTRSDVTRDEEGAARVPAEQQQTKRISAKSATDATTSARSTAHKSPERSMKTSSARAQQTINARRRKIEAQVDAGMEEDEGLRSEKPVIEEANQVASLSSNGRTVGSDYSPDSADEDDEEPEADGGGDELEQPAPILRKGPLVRPSEMHLSALLSDIDGQQPVQTRDKPGTNSSQLKTATITRKRTTRFVSQVGSSAADDAEADAEPAQTTEPEPDAKKLYGQWPVLHRIFRAMRAAAVEADAPSEKGLRVIVKLCKKTAKKLVQLKATQAEITAEKDPVPHFALIADKIEHLFVENEGSRPDFHDDEKAGQVYESVFPSLVRVLQDAFEYYEAVDLCPDIRAPLSTDHLETVMQIIKLILDLGKGLDRYDRPTGSAVVRPIKNGVLAPLKKVYSILLRMKRQTELEAEHAREAQHEASARALEQQREEQAARQKAEYRRHHERWKQLHTERMFAEFSVMTARKQKHLMLAEMGPEYDQNGNVFQRLQVFKKRAGPPPALVEASRKVTWSIPELQALEEGLRVYTGVNVFVKIFRRYCGRHGALSRFNVTEIVTVAADLKDYLIRMQQHDYDGVQDWVRAIPVWTQGHPPGKENVHAESEDEMEQEVDDDVTS